jgi:hypothetical protein
MVVHSCAAATSAREKISPVHRVPTFLGGTTEVMLTNVADATEMLARITDSDSMLR